MPISPGSLTPLVQIPAGQTMIGSEDFYPEEAPVHQVMVEEFWIEVHPVTNAQFAAFVADTGWVTTAEQPLPESFGLSEADSAPGSLVFSGTDGPVDLNRWELWWSWVPGASWRHPLGPESNITGKDNHPVIHVSFSDAQAYAEWAGRRLPTEVEWEKAAGIPGAEAPYGWGQEFMPHGQVMANTFCGTFPYDNTAADGWEFTSPVGSFPENQWGLVDMIGNVWEWTSSPFNPDHHKHACCSPQKPLVSGDMAEFQNVVKGGSHLCTDQYCLRYRPAARQGQSPDSSTTHLGFRCAASQRH